MKISFNFFVAAMLVMSACAHQPSLRLRKTASTGISAPAVLPILDEDNDPPLNPPLPGHIGLIKNRNQAVGIYNNSDYSPLLDLINFAEQSIDIEIYEMDDTNIRAALRQALARKVSIHVIKEALPLGEFCKIFDPIKPKEGSSCRDQKMLVTEINNAGGKFIPFNKSALCGQSHSSGCFLHGKMVLIDSKDPNRNLGIVSTGNFNGTNLCDLKTKPSLCNRDFTYVTRDQEVIQGLNKIFENDLASVRTDEDGPLSKKLVVSPYAKTPMIEFIKSAQKSIQLENQYMRDPDLNQALMDAVKNGVKVEVMQEVNCSKGTLDAKLKTDLTAIYAPMEQAGVALKFFTPAMTVDKRPGYLHAKAIVIDGNRGWIGSMNGSEESLTENREFGIFFAHPDRVNFLNQVLINDGNNPSAESWQESVNCGNLKSASPAAN